MDQIFADFGRAYNDFDGYLLASTISPEAPRDDPARLYNFLRSSNDHSIQTDLRYKLQYNPNLGLHKKEATAWLEIFAAYYNFAGHLLSAEEAANAGHEREADWVAVYSSWKDVVNALYKGYQASIFEVWTIPCLYKAGKYLRVFAIKADENSAAQRGNGVVFSGIEEDDAFSADTKNEKLEDAARQINRIFSLCITDRYVLLPTFKSFAFSRHYLR